MTAHIIWIFSRFEIDNSFHSWCRGFNESCLRSSPVTNTGYGEDIYWPFPNNLNKRLEVPTIEKLKMPDGRDLYFDLTIDAAMKGYIDKPGIGVVEPFWLSRRMDFQQGAFLMPFNVRYDFEYNLFNSLNMTKVETEERIIPSKKEELLRLASNYKVIKLRIPYDLHSRIKFKLETMNINDLTLFPDIDGALSHLTALLPRQK